MKVITSDDMLRKIIVDTLSVDDAAHHPDPGFVGICDLVPGITVTSAIGNEPVFSDIKPMIILGGSSRVPVGNTGDRFTITMMVAIPQLNNLALPNTALYTMIQLINRIKSCVGGSIIEAWDGSAFVDYRYFVNPSLEQRGEIEANEDGCYFAILELKTGFPVSIRQLMRR